MSPTPHRDALQRMAASVATVAAIVLFHTAAQAGGTTTTDCVSGYGWGHGGVSCVETSRKGLHNPYIVRVPPPGSDRDITEAAARDRLWQARCHPVIRQDAYGVRRYHYTAPGCEYGKYE